MRGKLPTHSAAAVCVAVLAIGGSASAASTPSPSAAALIARVEQVYRTVPGVRMTESAYGKHATVLYDLSSGLVTALQIDTPDGSGTRTYVSRTALSGYMKGPTSKCWTAARIWQQLPVQADLIVPALHPFPGFVSGFSGATVRSAGAGGWALVSTGQSPREQSLVTSLTVNNNFRLERWSMGTARSAEATVAFDTLTHPPTVELPTPIC